PSRESRETDVADDNALKKNLSHKPCLRDVGHQGNVRGGGRRPRRERARTYSLAPIEAGCFRALIPYASCKACRNQKLRYDGGHSCTTLPANTKGTIGSCHHLAKLGR